VEKDKNNLTKKQMRVGNRKHTLLNHILVGGRIYCRCYEHFLNDFDIEEHFCYTGNNGKRVCPSLRIETTNGEFIPYKDWASNNKKPNSIK